MRKEEKIIEKMLDSIGEQLFNIIYPNGLPKGQPKSSYEMIIIDITDAK